MTVGRILPWAIERKRPALNLNIFLFNYCTLTDKANLSVSLCQCVGGQVGVLPLVLKKTQFKIVVKFNKKNL